MSEDAEKDVAVPSTYQRLSAPFELSDHAKVPKGGMTQTYAPWTSYVERLNAVLGSSWSFRVIREGFTASECWVLGEITAVIDGETVTRQQYGCELIVKGQRDTPTTDLLKSAASDAIKKAASLLGPGLYLSIKEERELIDAAMQEAVREAAAEKRNANKPQPAPLTPKGDAAAKLTGAPSKPKTTQEWWAELVAEAERRMLPTLGNVKAISPDACGEAQLQSHCKRLDARLAELRKGAA